MTCIAASLFCSPGSAHLTCLQKKCRAARRRLCLSTEKVPSRKEALMKRVLYGLALAFAVSAFAQQQPPTNSPPYTTPPTFPEDQAPRQQMPPDTKAPPPQALSTAQIEQIGR